MAASRTPAPTTPANGAPSRARVRALATTLYAERRSHLLSIATRNSANRADAEDALPEALIFFIGSLVPDGAAPPLPWFILTLKRECWARHRREHLDCRAGCVNGGEEL